MTYEYQWLIAGRVLHVKGVAESVEELLDRDDRILHELDVHGKEPAVHVILDYSAITTEDESAQMAQIIRDYVQELSRQPDRRRISEHPLCGWATSVGDPMGTVDIVGKVISQVRQYKRHSAPSVMQALTFLRLNDATLPDDDVTLSLD